MRVIAGSSKGRRLLTPRDASLRPTSDRVKESMFNILGVEVEGNTVLDLFAGTGNLGIEAVSRGAERVVFVEKDREAVKLIEKNLSLCKMEDQSEVLHKDVGQAMGYLNRRGERFGLVLMDPPYEKGLIQRTLNQLEADKIYRGDSVLVIEHIRREPLPDLSRSWTLIRQRKIGDTLISFLTPVTEGKNKVKG
jgi:16S rRNA (guanine966-N2)-methyltransferase